MRLCAGLAATALACAGLAAESAVAAPGDTFFLSQKKNTFVSFAVRAGSDQASQLFYGIKNVPCKGFRAPPKPQRIFKLDGSTPITDGTFKDFWAPGNNPQNGALSGQVSDESATGRLRLRLKIRAKNKKKHGAYTCDSGRRNWTAKSVSEQRWLAARDNVFGN